MVQHSLNDSIPQSRLFVAEPNEQATFNRPHSSSLAPVHHSETEAIQAIFEQIKIYFSLHLKDKICLDELCKRFKCNKFYLLRRFKQYTGLSPINYLISLRIQNAKALLTSTHLPLVQVALESGFYDQSHFSNCFVKWVGLTPGEYRRASLK